MERIALFTAECAQVNPALSDFIRRNHDRIALVVTSDVYRGKRGSLARQVIVNFRRSGLAFVKYLAYSFLLYFAYARWDRLRASVTRTPRRCETLAEHCRRHGIPYLRTPDVNGDDCVERLREADLDAIVIYWFDQIIRERVIATPRKGVINVHAAHLPACRGLFPVLFSATKNDDVYGITAHQIEDTQIDAGPILAQRRVDAPTDRSILYRDAFVNLAGVDMIGEVLDRYEAHHAQRAVQGEWSYFSYPTRSDVREATRAGIRLATMKDFLAICSGELAGHRRRPVQTRGVQTARRGDGVLA